MLRILLMGLLLTSMAHAEVKSNMDYFWVYMNDLHPYLTSKTKFVDEASRVPVENLLLNMSKNVKDLKAKELSKSDGMKLRIQMLSEGLDEAAKTYQDGFREYSYWLFRSTLNNCYSCHTELGLPETKYKFSFAGNTSDYERADFLFLIRNYSSSIKTFKEIVARYPKNKIGIDELSTAVKKTVYYYMRVKRDDEALLASIKGFLKNKELPLYMTRDMNQWKKYLEIKKYRILPQNYKVETVKELEQFIDEREQIAAHFGENQSRFIVDQETLAFLISRIQGEVPLELKNTFFYWIAKIQRPYRESMFDNAAEIYLTSCLKLTAEYEVAKKCSDEFALQKLESFKADNVKQLPNQVRKQVEDFAETAKRLKPKTK